jgi:hypothetical protein
MPFANGAVEPPHECVGILDLIKPMFGFDSAASHQHPVLFGRRMNADQNYNPFLVGCAVGTSIVLAVVMAMHVLIG